MNQSHYPTQAELEVQRTIFALDSAEDRPYHFLARAHARMGRPWALGLGQERPVVDRLKYYPGEVERYHRLYIAEVPFQRTRTSGDRESWQHALREGRRLRVIGWQRIIEDAAGDPDAEREVNESAETWVPTWRGRERQRRFRAAYARGEVRGL